MKKSMGIILSLAALLLLAAPAVAAKTEYETYYNARFGFHVDVPDIFTSGVESDNGDGMTFEHGDGKYTLWVWGSHNVMEDTGFSLLEQQKEGLQKIIPGTAKADKGFYTIEFYDEDDKNFINHDYSIVTSETVIAYRLRFPAKERGRFANITPGMDKSLAFAGEGGSDGEEGFVVRDGKVFRDGAELEDAQFNPVSSDFVYGWAVLTPSVSDLVGEDEMGVFFFAPGGGLLDVIPLDAEYGIHEIAFCPDGGERFIFEDGSGSRADVFLNIYDASTMKKMAEYPGLRGSWMWIDPYRCVFTRIDDTREEGFGLGFGYGLKLSVVMYDVMMQEEFVLKQATDTANYVFQVVDGDELVIDEEWVEKTADWDDLSKRHEKKIRIEVPAAG